MMIFVDANELLFLLVEVYFGGPSCVVHGGADPSPFILILLFLVLLLNPFSEALSESHFELLAWS